MEEQKLVCWTNITFDIFDRFRILFGAKVQLKTTIHVPQKESITMYNSSAELKITQGTKFQFSQDKQRYGLTCGEPLSLSNLAERN